MSAILENSAVATGLEKSVFILIPKIPHTSDIIFVFLCSTYFTQYDVNNLQVHPYCCKCHCFILFMAGQYYTYVCIYMGLFWWLRFLRIHLQCRRSGFNPWIRKIPWRREWLPTPIFFPGELHRQRNLVGYSPWCHKESDTTEQLTHTHTHTCTCTCVLYICIICIILYNSQGSHGKYTGTGKPAMLQPIGSERVGYDLV